MADIQETNDDDDQAFEMTGKMLRIHPEIDTIFIVAAVQFLLNRTFAFGRS